MPTREELVATCERYVELVSAQDTEGIVALYAEDAWIEDPIGSERKVGLDAIREFYDGITKLGVTPVMRRIGPVTVCGGEAAFQFRIDIDLGETQLAMATTDVMTFDDAGRITSMRAYADGEANPAQAP